MPVQRFPNHPVPEEIPFGEDSLADCIGEIATVEDAKRALGVSTDHQDLVEDLLPNDVVRWFRTPQST